MNKEVELKEGSYYLVSDDKGNIIEIKCERVTKTSYFIKILNPNDKETPYYFKWISKYNMKDWSNFSGDYSVREELDPTWYRKQKT